jgi:membrane associated rhomboid family serine protease
MVIPLRDENPTQRPAVLTLALIVINVVIFVAWEPAGFKSTADTSTDQSIEQTTFLLQHAAVPCELSHREAMSERLVQKCSGDGSLLRQQASSLRLHKNIYLAVLVSMFMHASWLHLAGNMLFLWIFGNNIEDRLTPIPFIGFYLFCGVVATLAHVLSDPNSLAPLLGASGAIAGVMGAYLVFFPRARIVSILPIGFIFFVRPPAWLVLIGWFILQFFTGPNTGVAWVAHVGGFIAGAVIAFMIRPWALRDVPVRYS